MFEEDGNFNALCAAMAAALLLCLAGIYGAVWLAVQMSHAAPC